MEEVKVHQSPSDGGELFSNAKIVFGDYEYVESVDQMLGEGSFGCVFRGRIISSATPIAIKRMVIDQLMPEEVAVMKSIDSRFVVNLMAVFSRQPFAYFVMELCDCDLNEHLLRVEVIKSGNLDRLIDNIARGYQALYLYNIIHRDIKPSNILIKYDTCAAEVNAMIATAKLSDFSTSKISDSETVYTKLAGTPTYMAPEIGANILSNTWYDETVDMWSIGVVLYQCVTGEIPFDERLLCKLFLYAANENFSAYKHPPLPDNVQQKYKKIINGLLEIDSRQRLSPPRFFELVTGEKPETTSPTMNGHLNGHLIYGDDINHLKPPEHLHSSSHKRYSLDLSQKARDKIRCDLKYLLQVRNDQRKSTLSSCVEEKSSSGNSSGTLTPSPREGSVAKDDEMEPFDDDNDDDDDDNNNSNSKDSKSCPFSLIGIGKQLLETSACLMACGFCMFQFRNAYTR